MLNFLKEKVLPKIYFYLIPVYFLLDIFTKLLVVSYLPFHKYVPIFGKYVGFTYIFNKGAAFGLFHSVNPLIKNILFTIVTLGAIVFIFYLLLKTYKGQKIHMHACALILGGAFGNVSDRILGYMIYGAINDAGFNAGRKFKLFFGKVVDFVNIGVGRPHGKYRWPYFNFADACITIGLVILIVLILFTKEENANNTNKTENDTDNKDDETIKTGIT